MAERTLCSLTAADLGALVILRDGGATYEGFLRSINHDLSLRDSRRTLVSLRAGEWSHVKTYPSDMPCEVHPAEKGAS